MVSCHFCHLTGPRDRRGCLTARLGGHTHTLIHTNRDRTGRVTHDDHGMDEMMTQNICSGFNRERDIVSRSIRIL